MRGGFAVLWAFSLLVAGAAGQKTVYDCSNGDIVSVNQSASLSVVQGGSPAAGVICTFAIDGGPGTRASISFTGIDGDPGLTFVGAIFQLL